MTRVFLSILKTAKVFPVSKKDTKSDYSNSRWMPSYHMLKKYLKILCTKIEWEKNLFCIFGIY